MLRAGPHPDEPSTSAGAATKDYQQLYATLAEYLQLEPKFQPHLCLAEENEQGEVSKGARDGAAHVLRCLKVWFDLPADVLIHAINLFDRFLTKMKVRSCHVPCITVSCMNIALDHRAERTKQPRTVTLDELVSISQSACTPGDVKRMSSIIVDKLSCVWAGSLTALHWTRLFCSLLDCGQEELENLVEIAMCNYACANTRMSELALVLIYDKLERELLELSRLASTDPSAPSPDQAYRMLEAAAELQAACHMTDASLLATLRLVRSVRARYEARCAQPARQPLVWRLSERTLKVLRPTDRLTSLLPTIEEQQHNMSVDATPPRKNRSGSESSESETCDWPRSPVLPVYCDN